MRRLPSVDLQGFYSDSVAATVNRTDADATGLDSRRPSAHHPGGDDGPHDVFFLEAASDVNVLLSRKVPYLFAPERARTKVEGGASRQRVWANIATNHRRTTREIYKTRVEEPQKGTGEGCVFVFRQR